MTNEELLLLLSQSWGKFEKNGEEEEEKKNLVSLPDVLRVVSRRAPRRHHVTNLVRVAFESVALVFLFIFCAYERERERERVALVAFPIKYLHLQFKNVHYLFAHVQLELLHGNVVQL